MHTRGPRRPSTSSASSATRGRGRPRRSRSRSRCCSSASSRQPAQPSTALRRHCWRSAISRWQAVASLRSASSRASRATPRESERHYAAALDLCVQAGDPANAPVCLEGVAATIAAREPELAAARLLGAARGNLRHRRAAVRPRLRGVLHGHALTALGGSIGEDELGRLEASRRDERPEFANCGRFVRGTPCARSPIRIVSFLRRARGGSRPKLNRATVRATGKSVGRVDETATGSANSLTLK